MNRLSIVLAFVAFFATMSTAQPTNSVGETLEEERAQISIRKTLIRLAKKDLAASGHLLRTIASSDTPWVVYSLEGDLFLSVEAPTLTSWLTILKELSLREVQGKDDSGAKLARFKAALLCAGIGGDNEAFVELAVKNLSAPGKRSLFASAGLRSVLNEILALEDPAVGILLPPMPPRWGFVSGQQVLEFQAAWLKWFARKDAKQVLRRITLYRGLRGEIPTERRRFLKGS